MDKKRFHFFYEGVNDWRFIEHVLLPRLKPNYGPFPPWKLANYSNEQHRERIREISIKKEEYIFLTDLKGNGYNCVKKKRDDLKDSLNIKNCCRIIIVEKEIESWYLAGLKKCECCRFNIPFLEDTNDVTKDIFKQMAAKAKLSELTFRLEILPNFDVELAIARNDSFAYFWKKHFLVYL